MKLLARCDEGQPAKAIFNYGLTGQSVIYRIFVGGASEEGYEASKYVNNPPVHNLYSKQFISASIPGWRLRVIIPWKGRKYEFYVRWRKIRKLLVHFHRWGD